MRSFLTTSGRWLGGAPSSEYGGAAAATSLLCALACSSTSHYSSALRDGKQVVQSGSERQPTGDSEMTALALVRKLA
jgi:hypothetical protein